MRNDTDDLLLDGWLGLDLDLCRFVQSCFILHALNSRQLSLDSPLELSRERGRVVDHIWYPIEHKFPLLFLFIWVVEYVRLPDKEVGEREQALQNTPACERRSRPNGSRLPRTCRA
jgi:hypothetical protein